MEFHYTPPQNPIEEMFGGFFCINAVGKIYPGDDAKFQKFLEANSPPPRCTVYIDSSGGDVDAAMQIGRIIRGAWFSTSIGQYRLDFDKINETPILHRKKLTGSCMSAATLMYLGGRLRYFDDESTFGVHQFNFPSENGDEIPRYFLAKSQTLSARISEYVEEMGVSLRFLIISSSTPSDQMLTVSRSELEQIGVVTGGETAVKWTVEARNGMSYVKGEQDTLFGHHKVMLCYNKECGFMFWAVIESQGRAKELLGHSLVEIVMNNETIRYDISSRVDRAENGIYVNVLAQISEDEARQIALSDNFGVQIRMSHEAGMFLGVRGMDTTEGKSKLGTFFDNHSR